MLTIRFSRTGKSKQPYFRVIVSEKRRDPWAKYLELLGNYNPRTKKAELKVERIKHWLSVGAQASNSIHNFLINQGIIAGKKKKVVKITNVRKEKMAKAKAEKTAAEAKTAEIKTETVKTETPAAAEETAAVKPEQNQETEQK